MTYTVWRNGLFAGRASSLAKAKSMIAQFRRADHAKPRKMYAIHAVRAKGQISKAIYRRSYGYGRRAA